MLSLELRVQCFVTAADYAGKCAWLPCMCVYLVVGGRRHSLPFASVKSRLVLPFWYRLTRVVPDRGPLNVCVCACVCVYLVVGGTVPADTYEVALLNGCDLQDASQLIQVSQQQQQQQLAILYNNNIVPIS